MYCKKCGTRISEGNICPNCHMVVGQVPRDQQLYANDVLQDEKSKQTAMRKTKQNRLFILCQIGVLVLIAGVLLACLILFQSGSDDENAVRSLHTTAATMETEESVYTVSVGTKASTIPTTEAAG
ncbi:MAG: hypothetical protein LIO74_09175 [Ruminococcus sp.]|nr:hypothetical protein [Ruminococcus sp.]